MEEPNNFPEAMNQSIYTMIAVPYLTLGILGFLIYRGVRKNAAYRAAAAHARQTTSGSIQLAEGHHPA